MSLEVDSVCDAESTLNVVRKPSAMKIRSFDRDIVNAEDTVSVLNKKSLFIYQNKKPFFIKIRNPAVRSLPPSSHFLSTHLPPSPVRHLVPGISYVTQHDIARSSGNSRQLTPPRLVPPFLPPSFPSRYRAHEYERA